jgi:hypothetical protein
MKKILFLLLCSTSAFGQTTTATPYAETIIASELKENLSILASDALEGRKTGTRGQKMAAAFISNYFQEIGLVAPVNGSNYQPVELYSVTPADIYVKTGTARYTNFSDVMYFGSADSGGEITLDIVFAGKGNDTDYTNLLVKDKAVAIVSDPLSFNIMASLRKLVTLARDKGAKMVFVIPAGTAEEFKTSTAQMQGYLVGGNLSLSKPDPTSPNKGIFFLNQVAAEKIFNTTVVKLNAAAEPAKKMLAKIK